MIERVTDAATVEVGKVYLVPCVPFQPYMIGKQYEAPVNGPLHEDADIIGFPDLHWHHDLRFTGWDLLRDMKRTDRTTVGVLLAVIGAGAGEVTWRPRRCLRRMPTFPTHEGGEVVRFLSDLERAYAGHRLKPDCRTCPHRGLPLNGLPVVDNKVVCSGHGLAWDVTTGALVPRVAAPGVIST